MQIHKDFYKLFGNKEYLQLMGKDRRNLIVLSAIFLVTFTAIGFSNGSLDYLARKMKSPFVNWVSIAVPYELSETAVQFRDVLNRDELLSEFHISLVTAYNETPMNFWSYAHNGTMVSVGRSIEINDPVLNEIFNPKNLVHGRRFDSELDIGFIVTKSLLNDFGYQKDANFVYWRFKLSETSYRNIPLPVIAVVDELPGRYHFAITPYLYSILWESPAGSPFNPRDENELLFYVKGTQDKALTVKDSLAVYFMDQHRELMPFVMPNVFENNDTYEEGQIVKVTFRRNPEGLPKLDEVEASIRKSAALQPFESSLIRYYNYGARLPHTAIAGRYHHLSVNFSNLTRIRDFSAYLLTINQDFKLDIAQVESKENYDFISRLTRIISFILIIFSVYAASMFLSNIIRMHLEKISVNLGTMMAFGIDNSVLSKIYLRIALRFVSYAMAMAFIVSAILGYSGLMRLFFQLFQSGLESNERFYIIFNWWTLLTLIAIYRVSYLSVNKTLKKILTNTPGNLVYKRV